MKQIEIEFFWPLTEQIPLDLDYSRCSPHQYYLKPQGLPREGPFNTGMIYKISDNTATKPYLQIDADALTIKSDNMPWYRKLAYKIMGFKWK